MGGYLELDAPSAAVGLIIFLSHGELAAAGSSLLFDTTENQKAILTNGSFSFPPLCLSERFG